MRVKQQIHFPSPRRIDELHPEVLEDLRRVDPTVEVLYYDQGRWLLGSVHPVNQVVEAQARGILAEEKSYVYSGDLTSIRAALAALEGFRAIEIYHEDDLWSRMIVLDFRARDWLFRVSRPHMKEMLIAKACGDAQRAQRAEQRLDHLQAEYRAIHAHVFRNRRGVVVDGIKAAPGAMLN